MSKYLWQPNNNTAAPAFRGGLSSLTLRLLAGRGIIERSQAEEYLHFKTSLLSDPIELPDMEKAASRIWQAILKNRKIAVYGDFDADGVTATAIVTQGLSRLGAQVSHYIPNRFTEGYGLHNQSLEMLAAQGVNLIITVDCGISAINEICRLNELGVETIITDHHLPPTELPAAYAIVNPHLSTKLLFKELSGAGVAYKLISYLYGYLGRSREAEDFLALAAIGTVADIVPLVQDNRYLVEMGLRQINQKPSLGILELLRNAKLSESEVNAGKIAWIIGPRINAAGRLENASLAYRLLTAQDRQEAIALAVQLENLNARRQDLTNRFFQLAKQQVDINQKILFFQDEQCPKGVVGLVAGRICEEYNLPCIAINTEAELCVGSCRSIEGFDITKALVSCSSLLKRFGGHAQAAGFSAKKEQLPAIKAHLERYAYDNLKDRDPRPILHIDTLVKLDELSLEVVTEIKRMEPFGEGNKAPLFLSENLSVLDWRVMGKEEEHMLVKFTDGERLLEATAFNMKAKLSPLMKDRLDIVYNLEINEYNGRRNLRANLVDYRIHK